jgi:hypothetical protein
MREGLAGLNKELERDRGVTIQVRIGVKARILTPSHYFEDQLRAPAGRCSGSIGAVFALREDAARLLLEPRWNEQFGRAYRERVVADLSYQSHGDAFRFEPALRDLRLDQR